MQARRDGLHQNSWNQKHLAQKTAIQRSKATCMLLLWSSLKCVHHSTIWDPNNTHIYQVFTSKVPFHECTRDITVIRKVMSGERPARPSGHEISDDIWKIMKRCWRKDPSTRVSVSDVLDGLLGTAGTLDSGEKFKISGLASGFRELVLKRSWGRI